MGRKRTSHEFNLIRRVYNWVFLAVERDRRKLPVFRSGRDKAKITATICEVSESTVYRARDGKDDEKGKAGRPKILLDTFDELALCRLILGFYKRNPPELPTLEKIHTEALELPDFPQISRKTLHRIIKKLGFVCKKRNSKMNVYQRLDIVAIRHRVLRDLVKYRELGYTIFYQDETWCNAHHTREYIWQQDVNDAENLIAETKWHGGLNIPSGAGKRLIINHIGSEQGFLPNCGEVFVGKKDSNDYHSEMNGDHFEEWWREKVLPALPDRSVVLIDNAKYHSRKTEDSKRPNTRWRKADIQKWLNEKGVGYDEKDTIPILLDLSKNVFVEQKYIIEEITKKYCEEAKKEVIVLRLPIGHSELNAIELIWAQIKNEVARKNVEFTITSVKALVLEAMNNVTANNWKRAIAHVNKVEEAFRKQDFGEGTVPQVEPVVISLNVDSDSDSDSDYTDDEELS